MTTICVRPVNTDLAGRATCPCGWVLTTTKKAAVIAARKHSEDIHGGTYTVLVNYRQEQ